MAKGNNTASTAEVLSAVQTARAAADTATQTAVTTLNARLSELDTERAGIVKQLGELGVKTRGGRRSGTRARNDSSLLLATAKALVGGNGNMTPTEIQEAIRKGGYSTQSDNFPTMVSQSLSKLKASKVAKNVSRGVWVAGAKLPAYVARLEAEAAPDAE